MLVHVKPILFASRYKDKKMKRGRERGRERIFKFCFYQFKRKKRQNTRQKSVCSFLPYKFVPLLVVTVYKFKKEAISGWIETDGKLLRGETYLVRRPR